ncbi:MAG: hypothetical protein FJ220_04775 [Kiritimatiellaceae bacterium]|nr:hypothetical protein [Kiritimatiellaceae bacterium]
MVDGQSKSRSLVWMILPAFLVAGCMSVGPDYKAPEAKIPDVWNQVLMKDIHSNAPVLVE